MNLLQRLLSFFVLDFFLKKPKLFYRVIFTSLLGQIEQNKLSKVFIVDFVGGDISFKHKKHIPTVFNCK